jgi:hypothetical protein
MLIESMLIKPSHLSRIVEWDAFLSTGAVRRPSVRWTTTVASYRPLIFEDSEPKRKKQAYFKGVSKDTPGRQFNKLNQSTGATSKPANEAQRLAKVWY